jgi:hypothetical protein
MNANTENATELVKYEFKTKEGIVTIEFEDSTENPKFKIKGPKDLIHQAIGGLGFENQENTETTATEAHLDTEAKRMYAVLETLKAISENG